LIFNILMLDILDFDIVAQHRKRYWKTQCVHFARRPKQLTKPGIRLSKKGINQRILRGKKSPFCKLPIRMRMFSHSGAFLGRYYWKLPETSSLYTELRARVTGWVGEKLALHKVSPTHCCKNQSIAFIVEKSSPKFELHTSVIFKLTAISKILPYKRNFAQSSHPGWGVAPSSSAVLPRLARLRKM
jgi:hypothetical protein